MNPKPWHFGWLQMPCLMGIVNVTPDSFSDGGRFFDPAAAAGQARDLAHAGAQIVDLGAEATSFFRKGVEAVGTEEQLGRLLPVIELLKDLPEGVAISIDTRSAEVADVVLRGRAEGDRRGWIINDVSAGTHDPAMLATVAGHGAAVILMHISPGYPATPAKDDLDIVATVREYLAKRFAAAAEAGIAPERIAVDPGIGFGKTMADNWRLVLRLREIAGGLLEPTSVVLGASRKRFLETVPPSDVHLPEKWGRLLGALRGQGPEHPRDAASAALTAIAEKTGAAIHRVHDVALARRALGIFAR